MRRLYNVVACSSELDVVPQRAPSSLILLFAGTDAWVFTEIWVTILFIENLAYPLLYNALSVLELCLKKQIWVIVPLSFPSDWIVMLLFELSRLKILPKVRAATCGTSSAECPAFGSPETTVPQLGGGYDAATTDCCTRLLRPRAHHRSHAVVHWDARDWKLMRLWISAACVVHTILIKSSDRIVCLCKSSLKSEVVGMSANWHIRLLQQHPESLSLLQDSWFLYHELDLLACLLSKGLFLIFVELYLKCVFFWLLTFSFLHSGSQAGAQFLAHGFIPIALMGWVWCGLYHRTPGWAGCRHLLALQFQLWKQFCWQWKPSFAEEEPIFLVWSVWSLIRALLSDPLEVFPLSVLVHLSHPSRSYFCFFSKSLIYIFCLLLL